MKIRKAVLPLAGLATRMLPASKVIPKMMLPLVDKPTLQYIVEEAVAIGVEEIRRIQAMATYKAVKQAEPRGLGHAVLCAKELVGNEPFIVMLGDNLVAPETPCLPR